MIFYLCHCSLPVSSVSPCCFASFSKYLKLPQRIDSKNLQLVLVGKLCCEQGHLPPEQPLIQPDLEQLFPSNLLMAFHRQKQLEDILVLAKQFHETTEPVSDWLAVTEKKLANSEPIGTQTAKIQQQISRHKVGAGRRWLEPAPAPAVVSTTTRGVFGTNKDWRRFEKAANPDPLNIKLVSLCLPADLDRKKKNFPFMCFFLIPTQFTHSGVVFVSPPFFSCVHRRIPVLLCVPFISLILHSYFFFSFPFSVVHSTLHHSGSRGRDREPRC